MIRLAWAETLFELYKQCRDLPFWNDVKSLHDEEDRAYFETLDGMIQK